MSAPLTKNDVEDAVRRVLESHSRSPWLATEGAAGYLSSTPGTMRSWRANGEGPRYHVFHGKSVRYHVDDLDAFVRGEGRR
ncbi:DNA-binding protein [Methylosinus sp. H3A]|uniref:helix-turn-helix domain-containing protein n=1 Tax=Methylosinus sp. H3A TaxID=2785786 RepID=UPI0018C23ADB|nr:helix-turn-helix domain-containing protein [Methylosinus sp. H3A]MBG0811873.1 DNA-binding protein [Methylosinus sp. H3A]